MDIEDTRETYNALMDLLAALTSRVAPEPAQEIAQALKILAPNMPESGLLDACRQVKQVAISEADNSEKLEAQLAALTAERDEARAEIARLQQERDAYAGKLHKLQARLTPEKETAHE